MFRCDRLLFLYLMSRLRRWGLEKRRRRLGGREVDLWICLQQPVVARTSKKHRVTSRVFIIKPAPWDVTYPSHNRFPQPSGCTLTAGTWLFSQGTVSWHSSATMCHRTKKRSSGQIRVNLGRWNWINWFNPTAQMKQRKRMSVYTSFLSNDTTAVLTEIIFHTIGVILVFIQTAGQPLTYIMAVYKVQSSHMLAHTHTLRKVCDRGSTMAGLLSIGWRTGVCLCSLDGQVRCLYSAYENTRAWQVQSGSLKHLQYRQKCKNNRSVIWTTMAIWLQPAN